MQRRRRYLYADVPVPRRTAYRQRKRAEREAQILAARQSTDESDEELPPQQPRRNLAMVGDQQRNEFNERGSADSFNEPNSDDSNSSDEQPIALHLVNPHDRDADNPFNNSETSMSNSEDTNSTDNNIDVGHVGEHLGSSDSADDPENIPNYNRPESSSSELNEEVNVNDVEAQPEDLQCGYENNGEQAVFLRNPLCPCTATTEGDVFLMCLALGIRHNLTWTALVDILKMVNKAFGRNVVQATKYYFLKYMEQGRESTKIHIFCPVCEGYIGSKNEILDNEILNCACGEEIKDVGTSSSYFMSVNLDNQLRGILKDDTLSNEIMTYRFQRQKISNDAIEDVFDGEGYKRFFENEGPLSNPENFSVGINTDGIALGKSSAKSAWPIFLQINELSPSKRKKHLLYAGIWVGKKQPNMRIFLRPFVQEMVRLMQDGVTWTDANGIEHISKVFPIVAVLDSGARYKFLNLSSYSAYFGCTICYQKCENTCRGRRFTIPETPASLRTHESMIRDAQESHENRNHRDRKRRIVKGCKGFTLLMHLQPYLNLGDSVIVDFLHNALQGVTRTHTANMLQSFGREYYVGAPNKIRIINARLSQIRPPTSITRTPRAITECKIWKASEWRSWLLFYSILCLDGLIPDKYLHHFALISAAFYTLLQNSISSFELELSHRYLLRYVFLTQEYFGKLSMLYNTHLLVHVVQGAKSWGPLWSLNTFVFEGENRHLMQMHTSPGRVAEQITRRYLTFSAFPVLCEKYASTESPIEFIQEITGRKLHAYLRSGKTVLIGKGSRVQLTQEELLCIQEIDIHVVDNNALSFSKFMFNGARYTTNTYSMDKRNDDSWMKLSSGNRGHIEKVYNIHALSGDTTVLLFREAFCDRDPIIRAPLVTIDHIKRLINRPQRLLKAALVSQIVGQCIKFDLDNGSFICDIPYGCLGD